MLIEGDDGAYRQLSLSRPNAICLHAAVCGGRFGTVHWASRAQQQGSSGASGSGGSVWELMPEERRFGVHGIDLLTVNVAGAELEVLKGVDFSRLAVKVLAVGRSSSSTNNSSSGDSEQQGGSQAAAIAALLAQAGFEAAPAGPGEQMQPQGSWTVFVNSHLQHHLRQALEA
ncbi:family methyltransferase [Chlorella sorokiniana]|uniref:Family methyltransferase n=1 Tax=Chlorella sorokiniana TaxID=3076 RepID=A0A2P6U3B7_CHLSO|nr:family methyltransferase [Chlorella sorokiniana]|eukprot:PRW60795.1 family methyltransferase [Chlorella sorokiniana]